MAKKKKGKGRRSKVPTNTKRIDVPDAKTENEKAESSEREEEQEAEQDDEGGEEEQEKAASDDDDRDGEKKDDEPGKVSEPPAASSKPAKKASPSRGRKGGTSAGVLAVYDHPDTILHAATKARDKGFEKWDVYTPFPIHGMDDAMGLGRSPVPWITFTMGVVGFASAIIIQFGTMVYSWPLNFGGKPFAAWPSFVPITFEMTVLLAGVSTAIGSLLLGGMFKLRKRIVHPDITSHRFAIFVQASDPKYDEEETLSLFEGSGAIEVRTVKEGE